VRKSAFCSDWIQQEEHTRWFAEKLNDPQCFQFVALDDRNAPVGQVRFDIKSDEAEIDVSIDKDRREQGWVLS